MIRAEAAGEIEIEKGWEASRAVRRVRTASHTVLSQLVTVVFFRWRGGGSEIAGSGCQLSFCRGLAVCFQILVLPICFLVNLVMENNYFDINIFIAKLLGHHG